MKIYNGWKITLGLIAFLLVINFPFWYGGGRATPPPKLSLDTPEIAKLQDKLCIESLEYMRANHGELLERWKEMVVRDGIRTYTASDGRQFTISLSASCLQCHSNTVQFCDRCHNYTAVRPNCFSCHNLP